MDGTKDSELENVGYSNRQVSNGEGVRGVQGESGRATLGMASHKREWVGACETLECRRQGKQNLTDNWRTGLEGSYHMGKDQAGTTEYSDKEGGGTGDGNPGAPVWECVCGLHTGEKVGAGHSHLVWRGVRGLGNGGGESALGGNCGGLESG